MSPIAFFDFDGTITRHDTLITFGRFARGDAHFIKSLLSASPWLVLWKIGLIGNALAKEKLFGHLFKGMGSEEFHSLAEAFATEIDGDLRPDTMAVLKRHRAQAHRIVIVSASIGTWIEPWAKRHGIDCVIATQVEVDGEGRLTGHFATPNCHGREKVRRIKAIFTELGNVKTYAYGDSAGDDAMLQFVKNPQKV